MMSWSDGNVVFLTDEDLLLGSPPRKGGVGEWIHFGFAGGWIEGVDVPKPMEDALVAGVDGDRLVGFVADAHGGSYVSRLAAEVVADRLEQGGVGAKELVEIALRALDEVELPEDSLNQTTLLAVVVDPVDGVMEVASLGDSICILLRDGLAYSISRPEPLWVGPQTAGQFLDPEGWPNGTPPWWPQRVSIDAEDRILIATDGVIEPIYRVQCVTEEDLVRFVDDPVDLASAADRLLQESLRRDRNHEGRTDRGGEDNVAFVLFEVP